VATIHGDADLVTFHATGMNRGVMNSPDRVKKLAGDLRVLAMSGVTDLESKVEICLDEALASVSSEEKLSVMEQLAHFFGNEPETTPGSQGCSSGDVTRLLSLFLGKSIDASDLSSEEMSDKFAIALNTLFDTLNQIISVINVTLLGQRPEMETIRKVIGSNIENDNGHAMLKDYLDQIQKAFLVAHRSFQEASATVCAELLTELDPEEMAKAKAAGLKFGALRKAELFEIYEEKHARCKRWLDSGEFRERLLREFEKTCQLTFNKTKR
jgi:hypothetical protein